MKRASILAPTASGLGAWPRPLRISEGRLDRCPGGGGVEAELLHPAPVDDDEGGDQGVGADGFEVPQGLRFREVREEAGQEGDEAVHHHRPLGVSCHVS